MNPYKQVNWFFTFQLQLTLCVGLPVTALHVAVWLGLGYSFHDWRERQRVEYVSRLQQLVDRKERRDKWDAIYHTE